MQHPNVNRKGHNKATSNQGRAQEIIDPTHVSEVLVGVGTDGHTMQQEIPDDLRAEVARLAAGLNLGVEEALKSWVKRVRQAQSRLPDPPIMDEMISPPVELPRNQIRVVATQRGAGRLPDGIGLDS